MSSKVINTILNLQDKMSPKLIKVSDKVKDLDKNMQRATQRTANMVNSFSSGVDKILKKAGRLAKIGIGTAATAGAAGGLSLIKQSDAYAGIQARLGLINDSQQTVAQFNDKIFQSADRARSSYTDMASVVGKLGVTAGNAFKSNDEILKFSELLAKNFKISGASTEEQSAAMYQLTQAMGAGKLQGDEFRSIMENAPLLAQAIAKEMGVTVGQLKDMSSEGVITSDVIKSALFNSADEINKKYAEMPMTFGETVTKIKNKLTNALQPTFQKMSKWLNSSQGEASVQKIIDKVVQFVNYSPNIFNAFQKIYQIIVNVYNFFMKYQNIIIFLGSFILTLAAVTKAVMFMKNAFSALRLAGMLLNGTLELSPFGWIALVIAGVVAAGVLLWKNWDWISAKASELWASATASFEGLKNSVLEKIEGLKQGAIEKWQAVKDFFANPIQGTVNIVQKIFGGGDSTARNALGTSYFKGGNTLVGEHGPELVSLPSGSKIATADKTKQALGGKNVNVYMTIHGNVIGNEQFADYVGEHVVGKVLLALDNM